MEVRIHKNQDKPFLITSTLFQGKHQVGCFCKRDCVLPCYQWEVYFLFIALKRMWSFCKKVVSDLRFRRQELVLIRIKRKHGSRATPILFKGWISVFVNRNAQMITDILVDNLRNLRDNNLCALNDNYPNIRTLYAEKSKKLYKPLGNIKISL